MMKKEKVNIICLYWVGNFRGRDFSEEDVWRLEESVNKHIDRPYSFYCLTNDCMSQSLPGQRVPLSHLHDWPGWWSKMELHRGDLPKGRTLYLDLDTHVVNSLQPILNYEGDLVMFPSPYKGRLAGKEGVYCKYQAGIMLFTPGKFSWMYDKFKDNPELFMKMFRADQDLMGKWVPNLPTFPSKWLMKMSNLRHIKKIPEEVIFVTGQPKDENFRNPRFAPWLNEKARGAQKGVKTM